MAERTKSADLPAGTRLRHRRGDVVVLVARKKQGDARSSRLMIPFHPGWWLTEEQGGLADWVIDAEDSDWQFDAAPSHGRPVMSNLTTVKGLAPSEADAEFIAHARTDLPRALDEIERLRAIVERAIAAYEPCDIRREHAEAERDRLVGVVDALKDEREAQYESEARLTGERDRLRTALQTFAEHVNGIHDDNRDGTHTEPFADCRWDLCEAAADVLGDSV